MKKLIVPALCVLIGCAAGAASESTDAQTPGAAPPDAQRWENYCALDEALELGDLGRARNRAAYNELLAQMGADGWELVALHPGWAGPCFRRPAR